MTPRDHADRGWCSWLGLIAAIAVASAVPLRSQEPPAPAPGGAAGAVSSDQPRFGIFEHAFTQKGGTGIPTSR